MVLALLLAGSLVGEAGAAMAQKEVRVDKSGPLPRDGSVAVQEELCAARRSGTVEAYELFIARHPDSELAAIAKRELASLRRGERVIKP